MMSIFAVVMLYPFYFMLNTSFKSNEQFISGSNSFSLDSWDKLFSSLPITRQLINSIIVCFSSILIILILSSLAGFGLAKLKFKGTPLLFIGIIGAMLVPLHSVIIPAYVNISKFHLLTSYWGAVIMYAALGTPFATFLMTSIMDGLNFKGIFRKIAIPLALPAIATVVVLQFIQIWCDLLVGLLFLQNPENRTLTVGLGALSAGRTTDIPVLMAGSLVSAVPAIIVYLVFQKQIVTGLTAGIGK
jgi:multiple sugar transport system permease protein/raffinose/stachyose/melibiose transport system permease protein